MRIIGTTATGFLIDATEEEIARLMGYRTTYEVPYRNWATSSRNLIGREIPFIATLDRLREIQAHEARARDAARMLKALADMIEGALPSTMIPPAPAATEGGAQ